MKGMPMTVAAYDALIQALCKKEEFSEVLKLLSEMGERGFRLSLPTCRVIAQGFQMAVNVEEAAEVLQSMVKFGWVSRTTSLDDLVGGNQDGKKYEDSGNLLKQMA